ncbi:hypothetical protein AB0L57_30290 [Nocardia sp. NPDC052254]|uniref:hypothetical protein n=1 Tax=Nocardia sp. NPDC052254 TaxID=3155681 RepID=UPI0034414841
MPQPSIGPVTARTFGILADGAFKVLLAGVYALGAGPLSHRLAVPPWLLIVCGAALLVGGVSELGYLRSRPVSAYLPLMIAYDSGWVAVTVAALLLARQDTRWAAELWIGYQTLAPLAFAAVLAARPRTAAMVG